MECKQRKSAGAQGQEYKGNDIIVRAQGYEPRGKDAVARYMGNGTSVMV